MVSLSPIPPFKFLVVGPKLIRIELDNIQKSDRVQIRDQAREAMKFLLRLVKLRRDDPNTPLRVQKQSEILDPNLRKADDKILDCCLVFKPRCGQVWLWTKDLNLNVKAESNDVPMLDRYSLQEILKCLGISDVEEVLEELHRSSKDGTLSNTDIAAQEEETGGMDFDIDLVSLSMRGLSVTGK